MDGVALVLSKSFEPIDVVPWQRALALVATGQARVIEEDEDKLIRTPKLVFRMPLVIQHLKAKLHRNRPVKFSRINVYARDNFTCCYCGKKAGFSGLNLDHVLPRSKGGRRDWFNIVTSCIPCNDRKGGRTPEEAGMKLRRKPARPVWAPGVLLALEPRHVPEVWRSYLPV